MAPKTSTLSKEYISESESESSSDSDLETIENVEFKPPSDYKKCSHLKKFKLSHKSKDEEIWLFSLPNSIDLSSLKTLPLPINNDKSDNIIQILNKNYNVTQTSHKSKNNNEFSNLKLLVPSTDSKKDSLKILSSKDSMDFNRIFTLSEVTEIPKIDIEKVKLPRKDIPQLENLELKHFPTGYDSNDFITDGNDENTIENNKSKSKKRHGDDDDTENKKKKKKSKKDKSKKKEKK
ncbi:DNA-directed RNA polymerase I subunit RPA34 NDAI_0A01060 [Naumovozyma dairenensis CBS 421]|uniref:DNA-directed RNA polymerase I subunit RPA34 n=1 Tax=Naumovozyma dairenensis (strain ATCC 10597 / BCRC 20456 / CBS 421 / NBRC 0211 / NRRL Y-12639) TaxID=1071378 RepID=G0W376_NAUDC|nr:hypothetical protein NDAI_0A01060 [Naumovozyma dairenensis CBS 421]CCD22264.1 hypothetical protein NDAI_0A01060 [Naumovozyma dairenensis CBS 421]